MIVGIDEVGRGAWAGPLVVGAVLLGGVTIEGLTDSKKLTKKQRMALDLEIRQKAKAVGIGWVSAKQIDQIGLSPALKLAAARALVHIRHEYREIIIDGTIRLVEDPRVTLMKKADLLIPSVSAASIVAKVARDNYMGHLDGVFSGYKFKNHVGYGTAAHRSAIKELGVTPLHRLSFMPLRHYSPSKSPAKQVSTGGLAEGVVASTLEARGHRILERNWRTKYCEIDIISEHAGVIYFTEVKYRKSDSHGDGLAAITPTKLRQMRFAAQLYIAKNPGSHMYDQQLAAANATGRPPRLVEFLELA